MLLQGARALRRAVASAFDAPHVAVLQTRCEEFRCVVERRPGAIAARQADSGPFACITRWVDVDAFAQQVTARLAAHNVTRVYLSASPYTPASVVDALAQRLPLQTAASSALMQAAARDADLVAWLEMELARQARLFITDDCSSWAETIETARYAASRVSLRMHALMNRMRVDSESAANGSASVVSAAVAEAAAAAVERFYAPRTCCPLMAWSSTAAELMYSAKRPFQVSAAAAAADARVAPLLAPEHVVPCAAYRRPRKDAQGVSSIVRFDALADAYAARRRACNVTFPWRRGRAPPPFAARLLHSCALRFIYVDAAAGAAASRELRALLQRLAPDATPLTAADVGSHIVSESRVFSVVQDPLNRFLSAFYDACVLSAAASPSECLEDARIERAAALQRPRENFRARQ